MDPGLLSMVLKAEAHSDLYNGLLCPMCCWDTNIEISENSYKTKRQLVDSQRKTMRQLESGLMTAVAELQNNDKTASEWT